MFRNAFLIKRIHSAAVAVVMLLAIGGPVRSYGAEMPDVPDILSVEAGNVGKTERVLGVSWQPGYCEGQSKVPECANQSPAQPDARQFSLHGLWQMNKTYCGVPAGLKEQDKQRKWLDMPELALDDNVKAKLALAMPGTRSGLDRHEWVKHGTCSGEVAAAYYARSLELLDGLNDSAVQSLFETSLGKRLTERQIKAAFDESFGPGAGERVKMRCRKDGNRRVITGLTIGLGAGTDGEDDLGDLISAAGTTRFGCPEGIVDEAGLQ